MCADLGVAGSADDRCHVGNYSIKEPFATAASLDEAYGGGRERKRRRQYADTAVAVEEGAFPRAV